MYCEHKYRFELEAENKQLRQEAEQRAKELVRIDAIIALYEAGLSSTQIHALLK